MENSKNLTINGYGSTFKTWGITDFSLFLPIFSINHLMIEVPNFDPQIIPSTNGELPSGNQTWLAGKSSIHGGFIPRTERKAKSLFNSRKLLSIL